MELSRNHFQRNTSWNAPYTFSGKEKDVETGYGYFGARYYDSGLSIWLSVDPMSDKYPSMSPYNYCANNPVILVDPDGRRIIVSHIVDGKIYPGHMNTTTANLLETFARTSTGNKFLSLFAAKGDKIGNYTFTKNGIFHEFNLYFNESNFGSGHKGGNYKANEEGGLHFIINLNTYHLMSKSTSFIKKLDYLLTIGHECFIHMSREHLTLINASKSQTKEEFGTTMNNWRSKAGYDDDHYSYITNRGNFEDFYNYLGDLSKKYNTLPVVAAKARHDKIYNEMLKNLQNEKK